MITAPSVLAHYPQRRLRRCREHPALRRLIAETQLLASDLVAPLFIVSGEKRREPISSMPGVERFSVDLLVEEVLALQKLGIGAVNLFPCISTSEKDACASAAFRSDALAVIAIQALRAAAPNLCIMIDVALDPFTDHGHDGIADEQGRILNDATLEYLNAMALLYAQAGADVIAPSDMMDGRVATIRKTLDEHGHQQVAILSYAAKFASSFYGPFRSALQSTLQFGDKRGYQLNPRNSREALMEALQDEAEGADMLMVKPALPYLDIIAKLRAATLLPIAAFHVSGEYAMIKAAAAYGWMDGERVLAESLISIKRAGADLILTWAAREAAEALAEERPHWRCS